ncbi:MAG: winged helix-turn-helix transcriptional regulator [Gaiellaceae bacterium]
MISARAAPAMVNLDQTEPGRRPHRYSAVQRAIPGINDKVLSGRLVELERAGILTRVHYPEIPPRVEYALTQAGLALESVIAEMDRWSREVASGMAHSAEAAEGLTQEATQPLPRRRSSTPSLRRIATGE